MSKNENGTVSSGNKRIIKGIAGIVFAVIAFFSGEVAALLISEYTNLNVDSFAFLARCITALIPFIILGRKQWLNFDSKAVKNTFSFAKVLLIFNVILGILLFVVQLKNGIGAGFAGRVIYSIYLVVLIGINEEVIFRGLLFCGLIAIFGKKKNSLLLAAVISSVCFGFIHVIGSLDFSNIFGILTVVLKTAETAMFAVIMCYCCHFNKNIIGTIIFHAIFDWLLLIGTMLQKAELDVSYVSTDEVEGIGRIFFFILMIVAYFPATVKAIKAFRDAEPTDGIFA